MTTDEMMKMNDDFMRDLRPLYLQLHTWAKYKLAEKYHQPVPNKIPAHWLNNRWAQEWTGMVEAANLDPYFKGKTRGVDREDGGAILYRPRFPAAARELLDEVGSLSGARGRSAEEKHPRLLLAHRSRQRHSLAAEHRAEPGMVLHRAPRARARTLFQGLHPPGSAAAAAHRARLPGSTKASAN